MREALTAIGLTALVSAPLTAIIFALVHAQIATPPGGGPPPWFPEFTALPYAIGAFAALALRKWSALVAVVAAAGLGVAVQLFNLTLWALGPQQYLVPDLRHTEIPRHLWTFAGIPVGAVAYGLSPRPRLQASGLLAAVGIFLVAAALSQFAFLVWWDVLCYSPSGIARCDDYTFTTVSHLLLGVVLGFALPRSASAFTVSGVLLLLALPSAVVLAFQWQQADRPVGVVSIGGGVLTALVAALVFGARRIRGGHAGDSAAGYRPA